MSSDQPNDPSADSPLHDRAVGRGDIRDRTLAGGDRPLEATERTSSDRDPVADDGGEGNGPLGVHPVGTAVGGVAGAVAAGAAVGAVAGPLGVAAGAAIGAAAGGMTGKLVAGLVDPDAEDEFWRRNWSDRHDMGAGFTYDQDYRAAYLYGVENYNRHPDRHYDEIEPELETGWSQARGTSRLQWGHARGLSRDAWQRARDSAERAFPREPDRGGN